jgi:hypothetical protein
MYLHMPVAILILLVRLPLVPEIDTLILVIGPMN